MVDTLSQARLRVARRTWSACCQLQPLVEPQPSQM